MLLAYNHEARGHSNDVGSYPCGINAEPTTQVHKKSVSKSDDSRDSGSCKEEIEAEVDEEHECPVCVDLLASPCTLPCEHTFCRLCLLKIATAHKKYLQPLCPLCRESFVLANLSVDLNLVRELREAYKEGSGGVNTNVMNETQPLTYSNRVHSITIEEQGIIQSLNGMMEERNESDRVPKDRFPF